MKTTIEDIVKLLNRYLGDTPCWIAGGVIRDWLLGRPIQDLDLVVPENSISIAKRFSRETNSTLIVLHEDEGISRVVIDQVILDFSNFRKGATTIEQDLMYRDFTINSMAIGLDTAINHQLLSSRHLTPDALEKLIIDPADGISDAQHGIIRTLSKDNLISDPLRILRAIRFATHFDFQIEPNTKNWLNDCALQIDNVSAERIQYELNLIISTPRAGMGFKLMHELGILNTIIPELNSAIGVNQPGFHHLDVFGHLLAALSCQDKIISSIDSIFKPSEPVNTWIKKHPDRLCWVKWASLLHDIGKPPCMGIREDGRVTFYQHDQTGANIVKAIGERLRWPKKAINFTARLVALHMRPFFLLNDLKKGGPTPRAISKLLKSTGDDYPALFMVAMADAMSAKGPLTPKDMEQQLNSLLDRVHCFYLKKIEPIKKSPRLLTGNDIQKIFGLSPGPVIGKILKEVEEARSAGEISTRESAISLVNEWLRTNKA